MQGVSIKWKILFIVSDDSPFSNLKLQNFKTLLGVHTNYFLQITLQKFTCEIRNFQAQTAKTPCGFYLICVQNFCSLVYCSEENENCSVIKVFMRVYRFPVCMHLQILAKIWSSFVAFSYT